MMAPRSYEFTSIPFKWGNKEALCEAFNGSPFSITYDFSLRKSIVSAFSDSCEDLISTIEKRTVGLKLTETPYPLPYNQTHEAYPVFFDSTLEDQPLFEDIFFTKGCDAKVIVEFIPVNEKCVRKRTLEIEKRLSSAAVRETNSARPGFVSAFGRSFQRELFFDSGSTQALKSELEGIKRAAITNGILYGILISLVDDNEGIAAAYLRSKFNLPAPFKIMPKNAEEFIEKAENLKYHLFPAVTLSRLIAAPDCSRISYPIKVVRPYNGNGVIVGNFLEGAVADSDVQVSINPTVLNLGFIITGLPGSGKTMEAMGVLDRVLRYYAAAGNNGRKPATIVISPTDEWNGFAEQNGLARIRLFDDGIPINFFRPYNKDSRFYEDLAMILSSASRAGPYQNPMEKCMLNAFRALKGSKDAADPVILYDAIEESVIKFHARRTNTGVKYTKHGENIRSALEDLRNILNRAEYSAREGVNLHDLFNSGVVFDMSAIGTTMRPYLYALVLNQVYSFAAKFDTKGDDELRLIICVEEAQTIFGSRNLAAVEDLKKRIQDFRKQGMAIVLLTHNVNDIDPGVRRLCQIKLYLRQAPDVAPIAAKDLMFSAVEEEELVSKLKHLDSRVAAFSYVEKVNGDKIAQDSTFIRTADCPVYENMFEAGNGVSAKGKIVHETPISIAVHNTDHGSHEYFIRILYLWEEVYIHSIDQETQTFHDSIPKGRMIVLQLLDRKQKILSEKKVVAKGHLKAEIHNGAITLE